MKLSTGWGIRIVLVAACSLIGFRAQGQQNFNNCNFNFGSSLHESSSSGLFIFDGNNCMIADNGRTDFIFQSDGNLVVYDVSGRPLWSSRTNGKGGTQMNFQLDRNLVIYAVKSNPCCSSRVVWATNKGVRPNTPATLVVQDDGNVVIYDANFHPLWATGTNRF